MIKRYILYSLVAFLMVACSLMKKSDEALSVADLYDKALDLQLVGNYDKALELYNKVIKMDSTAWKAYSNRGVIKGYLNDTCGAIFDYLSVHRLNPNDAISLYNIGCIYAEQEQLDSAMLYFQKAFIADSLYSLTYYAYGVCLFDKRHYRKAINSFKKFDELEYITIQRFKDNLMDFALEDYYYCYNYSLYYIGLSYKNVQNIDSAKIYLHRAVDKGIVEAMDSLKLI